MLFYSIVQLTVDGMKSNANCPSKIFSCEEAALEGQMLSVSVCLFDCLTPKLNITKVMLFEVYKTN